MRTIGIQTALACLLIGLLDSAGCQAGDYLTREDCDLDSDGYLAQTPECGGNDCDDHNQLINPAPNTLEKCQDNIDNNCDGRIDEGCVCDIAGNIRECTIDDEGKPVPWVMGMPKTPCRNGTQTCLPDATWSKCSGAIVPKKETCDEIDNNCDGEKDEDFNYYSEDKVLKIGAECSVGKGACKYLSTVQCLNPSTAGCKEVFPAPMPGSNEPHFTQARDKNGNPTWDWNCDGVITQKCCSQDIVGCSIDSDCHPTKSSSTDDLTYCKENCNLHLSNCSGMMFGRDIYITPILPRDFCGEKMIKICNCHLHISSCEALYLGMMKGQIGCY